MSKLAMCTHLTKSFAPKAEERDTMLAAHLGLAPIKEKEWRSDVQRRCPKKNWHMLSSDILPRVLVLSPMECGGLFFEQNAFIISSFNI